MTKRIVLLYTLLAMCLPLLFAGSVAEDRETRLRWWRDARFGMFIRDLVGLRPGRAALHLAQTAAGCARLLRGWAW